MLKKNDPNKKNRRKNKNKMKCKNKPKINNDDVYDVSTYFAEDLTIYISDETKQIFANHIQTIIDRNTKE